MEENKLNKLLQKLEADSNLKELGEIDEQTKAFLKKIADGEIDADQAIETFLDKNKKL